PAPWFDATALSMGITLGDRFPRVAPFGPMTLNSQSGAWDDVIAGRISITSGSTAVTGVDTGFTRDIDANGAAPDYNGRLRIRDAGGVARSVQVKSVESDTRLTLTAPWPYGTVSNTVADTYYPDPDWGSNADRYYLDNYYDTALVQYINYYRTGDVRFLEYARKTADAFWHSQWIGDGTVTGGPNHLPPRSLALAGLMLRALDGRPEMWDYLEREVSGTYAAWVYLRKNNSTLYYDIREDGYAQLYAVMMAKVLPDSYALYGNGTLKASTGTGTDGATKRATYLAQVEDTAVNFFGRLQRADGSWRWNVDDGPDPTSQNRDVEQPFMVGLYLESVVLLHQLTGNANVKTNLVNQLTRAVRHLYNDAFEKNDPVTNLPPYKWRSFFYYWGGGTVSEPNKYSPPSPQTVACGLANCGDDSVAVRRHLNSTIHHAFGYAYFITGDPLYKQMGDDVFDSSYGDQVDGIHALAGSGKGKDYDMNYRASGRYLVWRLQGSPDPTPTPTPTPTSTPTPTPTPSPSPSPTPTPSPTPSPSPTPTPTPAPPTSVALVSSASTLATSLAASSDTSEAQITSLVNGIGQAYSVFLSEFSRFSSADEIDRELRTSLYFTRGAGALAAIGGHDTGMQNRLQIVAYHLSRATSLMTGSSAESSLGEHAFAVASPAVIGPADTLSSASFAPVLAPASLGTILGDPNQSPLALQTTNATLSSSGTLPYELGGVSVAINGQAAPLVSVSPSRISFYVPANVPVGNAEVIVTLQEGYVSRGMTTIARIVPGVFTINGSGIGEASVVNAATLMPGPFSLTTTQNLTADKQTRLLILASGISNGAPNTNAANDVKLGLGMIANLAESVVVEARTSDGRIIRLPVEFAGADGRLPGLDQIIVVIPTELKGVGTVELSLIVAGQRSNAPTVTIN
ncbi:MAG TPA: hypothetical protein VGJ55_14815, partial [Pyrinomonadaceae bacterium]